MLKLNESHWDRGCRLVLGVAFGTVAVTGVAGSAVVALGTVLTVILFATAATGFCPLYELLGIDTRPERVKG